MYEYSSRKGFWHSWQLVFYAQCTLILNTFGIEHYIQETIMEPSSRTIYLPQASIDLNSKTLKRKNAEDRIVTHAKETLINEEMAQNIRPKKKTKSYPFN